MNKEIQEEALLHIIRSELADTLNHNAQIAFEWTADPAKARWIAEAVEGYRNILVIGPVASGKTKFINELLRMYPPDDHFRYIYQNPSSRVFSEYEIHSEFHNRVEYSINMAFEWFHIPKKEISSVKQSFWRKPDFYVIDDLKRKYLTSITQKVKKDFNLPMIATIQCSNKEDVNFIDMYLKHNFDVFIFLNRYKEVSRVLFSDHNM